MRTSLHAALAATVALSITLPALAATSTAPVARRVHPERIEASSFLWNDWNKFQENYLPTYAADGDPKTAWTEGAQTSGAGEWIRFRVTRLEGTSAVTLRVQNGYQKTPALFKANARIARATITLLPSKTKQTVDLADAEGWQEITVAQPAGPLEAIEIHVDKVFEGTRYTDLCLSDVELTVTATAPQNPALEKANARRIAAWKAERVSMAREMKAVVAKGPLPVLPSYKLEESDVGDDFDYDGTWNTCKSDAFCHMTMTLAAARKGKAFASLSPALDVVAKVAARDLTGFVPVRFALKDRRKVPQIDGIAVAWLGSHPFDGTGYVALPLVDSVSMFDAALLGALGDKRAATASLDKILAGKAPGCRARTPKVFAWALYDQQPGQAQRVRALVLARCGLIEEREGTRLGGDLQVVTYDATGKLELLADSRVVVRYVWKDGVIAAATPVHLTGSTGELSSPPPVVAEKP
jgi:hypothetical protein